MRVVRDAVGVGTAIVRVEVLVYIEDQVGNASIRVRHFAQGIGRTIRDESLSRRPVVSWKEDELGSSTVIGTLEMG